MKPWRCRPVDGRLARPLAPSLMPKYIPSQPVVSLRSLIGSRRLSFPHYGIFSCARYGLLSYLDYVSQTRPGATRRVLLPDYMCRDVGHALKQHGYEPRYYPLGADFEVSMQALEDVEAQTGRCQAIVLGHFYGRLSRNRRAVARWCREKDLPLIEDCVHLPFPHHAAFEEDRVAAKLYSLRKVYPVPHGGVLVVGDDRDAFADFLSRRVGAVARGNATEMLDWMVRQVAKKALLLMKMSYAPPRRDGGDEMPPFNYAWRFLRRLLPGDSGDVATKRRRENYALYMQHRDILAQWGDVLALDAERDVPYMFVIFLKEHYDAGKAASRLEALGIPAGTGLALDPAVSAGLPRSHPYRRILTLPVHQDIDAEHIAHIMTVLGNPAIRAEVQASRPGQASAVCAQAMA